MHAPSTHIGQRNHMRTAVGLGQSGTVDAIPGGVTGVPSLTQANLARINNVNAQECHQGKLVLQQSLKKVQLNSSQHSHHQNPETVADASYYSSVLNSFGAGTSAGKMSYDEAMPQNPSGPPSWQQQQQQPPPPPPSSYYR